MKSQKNGTKEKTQKTKIQSMSYNNYIPLKYQIQNIWSNAWKKNIDA